MVSMMVYNSRDQERDMIQRTVLQAAAHLTEEKWELRYFEKMEQMKEFLADSPLLDLACYDVSGAGSIDYLE